MEPNIFSLSPFFSFVPLVFSYAEIHYHFRFLFPRYYRKLPEIISDVPIRVIKLHSSKLPVLIIIKDSHLFPIDLKKIKITVMGKEKKISKDFSFDFHLNQQYFSRILKIDINYFKPNQILDVAVDFTVSKNSKKINFRNDNYAGLSFRNYQCYYSEKPLPYPENWYAGEPHYHSTYTSDQVEFGADIESTKIMAKSIGLSWLFVTDHSYDLDDCENSFLKNDPLLPKWKKMLEDVQKNDSEEFRILPGEEISIGNSKKKNVHLLAINLKEFIEGKGDSAEVWFKNKPQKFLEEIIIRKKQKGESYYSAPRNSYLATRNPQHAPRNPQPDSLFIAAHPNEKISFLQKLTLRRGNWHIDDFLQSGIKFLQIINNSNFQSIEDSIHYWKTLLLDGHKFFIIAGNDAHGNFNVMRQIKIPFIKLFSSVEQVFGKFHTVFNYKTNDPIKGIKSGKIIVSNGPFLNFRLETNGKKYPIGSTIPTNKAKIYYETKSTPEFGEIEKIKLFIGDYSKKVEKLILNFQNGYNLEIPENGYVRMSMITSKMGRAYTNPVWIRQIKQYET
ncbi:MAG: hypothetical protein HQ534_06505 [Armatimonadetes bacterium]|nr:hypothetical protein [Armatimonadota bacterium]